MFDSRDKQLADLETAYAAFIETMQNLDYRKHRQEILDGFPAG